MKYKDKNQATARQALFSQLQKQMEAVLSAQSMASDTYSCSSFQTRHENKWTTSENDNNKKKELKTTKQ